MIRPDAELYGKSSFREWASLFSGKYFAMIVVYSDETGTGGLQNGEEPAPGVYGYLATPEMWDKFRVEWKASLEKHKVPYFHFRKLHPNERKKTSNPYHLLDKDMVDDFIYDMAIIASGGPIPFGGNVAQNQIAGPNPNKFKKAKVYRKIFYTFFSDFKDTVNHHFPKETEKVSFFFSDIDNEDWIRILSQIIKDARHHNPLIGEYAFVDPYETKNDRGLPCQVADLFAYVNRQHSSNMYEAGHILRPRLLDIIIGRHAFSASSPLGDLSKMPEKDWRELVADLRKAKKEFETNSPMVGGKKQVYHPTKEHPFFKKLNLEYAQKSDQRRNAV